MFFELSHDTIARQVYDKASTEARTRRKVERFIRERYEAYRERGAKLTQDDVDFVTPYLTQVNIDDAERDFVEYARRALRRKRRGLRLLIGLVLIVLFALTAWARIERNVAEKNRILAEANAEQAQAHAAEALTAKKRDSLRAIDLGIALKEADAAKRADSLKAIELGISLEDARRAREAAEVNAREARALALAAKAKALSRDDIPTALRLAQLAWEMAPVPHPDISRTLTSIFYSQLAVNKLPARPILLASAPGKEVDFGRAMYRPGDQRVRAEIVGDKVVVTTPEGIPVASLEKPEESNFVRAMVQSADGRYLLGVAPTGDVIKSLIHLWAGDGQLLRTFGPVLHDVKKIQFSADNTEFLVLTEYNGVQVFNLADGEVVTQLPGGTIFDATFSADGRYIAQAQANNMASVWTRDGQCLSEMRGADTYLNDLRFSADGQYVVASGSKETSYLWNWRGALMADLGTPRTWPINTAHFTADSREVITCADDGVVKRWRLDGLLLSSFAEHQKDVQLAIPSPDGRYIASSRDRGELFVWRKDDQQVLAELTPHDPYLTQVVFSPDSRSLLTCGAKNGAPLFTLEGALIRRFGEAEEWIKQVAFSLDGQKVATVHAHPADEVKIWALDGQLLATFAHPASISSIQFSPDGQYLLTACDDKVARVWRMNGQLVSRQTGHPGGLTQALFAPDGQEVLTSGGGWLRRWDLRSQRLHAINQQRTPTQYVALSPDGRYILAGSNGAEILLWGRRGGVWAGYPSHGQYMTTARFSPDGRYVLTAGKDGLARLRPTPEYILHYLQTEAAIPELTEEQRAQYGIKQETAETTQ